MGAVVADSGQGRVTMESRLVAGMHEGKSCKNATHSEGRGPKRGIRSRKAAVNATR